MRNLKNRALVVATLIALGGCQSSGNTPSTNITPQLTPAQPTVAAPISIDGKWKPSDADNQKIYYNEFRKGKFAAYTVDGKNTLALGTYTRTTDGVKFKYFSQSRNKEVNADCKLFGSDRLQCSVEGSIVDLQRA